ncbi:MAG TPA: M56 family metallopeptidase [Pirellulales bacterium]|nr:M56 family metallopeptidase [Pirellulales bacterium]
MNGPWVVFVERVGIALVHSLWQGAFVGLLLMIALVALRHARAQVRYLACCLALATTLLLPVCTFLAVPADRVGSRTLADQARRGSSLVASAAAALEAAASLLPEESPGDAPRRETTEQAAPNADKATNAAAPSKSVDRQMGPRWLSPSAEHLLLATVAAWSAGVIFLSCRVLGGYFVVWRLSRRLVTPLDDAWQTRFRQLARRLGIDRPVELWQSAAVEVPAVLGWFRPVILVPVGMLTGLSVAHVESILAHELAHVRRHDFLVNAVQSLIETLLFYHPCVWWISARIRAEREHCCDETAVAACGDALVYARALTGLEELRPPARLAMALTGGGPLLRRIRRIVGRPRAGDVIGGWLAGSLAIALPLAVGGAWAWEGVAWGRVDRVGSEPVVAERTILTTAAADAQPVDASAVDKSTLNETTTAQLTVDESTADNSVPPAPAAADEGPSQATDSSPSGPSVGSFSRIPASPIEALLAGRPKVGFLVPQQPGFRGPPADLLPRMVEEHGAQRVVQVVVSGLPEGTHNYVYDHLWRLLPNLTYFGTGGGDTVTVHLAPIDDLDAFAARIDLGEIRSIDREQRTITVAADRTRLPRPQAPTVVALAGDVDLETLCQRLVEQDWTAVDSLVAFGPEAESAVAPYVAHDERRVRRAALLVLKRVATDASLPVLRSALADADLGNRDLAWQAICHVPGLTGRPEVIETAGAALARQPEQAAKWLVTIGPPAEPFVWPALRNEDPRIRLAALSVLKQIGTARSIAALEAMSDEEVEEVARAVGKAREAIARR